MENKIKCEGTVYGCKYESYYPHLYCFYSILKKNIDLERVKKVGEILRVFQNSFFKLKLRHWKKLFEITKEINKRLNKKIKEKFLSKKQIFLQKCLKATKPEKMEKYFRPKFLKDGLEHAKKGGNQKAWDYLISKQEKNDPNFQFYLAAKYGDYLTAKKVISEANTTDLNFNECICFLIKRNDASILNLIPINKIYEKNKFLQISFKHNFKEGIDLFSQSENVDWNGGK